MYRANLIYIMNTNELISDAMDAPDEQPSQISRAMTFGEKLVGLTFNPSNDDKVSKAKSLCAELADLINDENEQRETLQFSQRLFSHSVCEILNAQMNVVKFLTLKY